MKKFSILELLSRAPLSCIKGPSFSMEGSREFERSKCFHRIWLYIPLLLDIGLDVIASCTESPTVMFLVVINLVSR